MSSERYTAGAYLEANPTWHVEDSAWKADHVLRMMDRHSLAPRRICEVGCGAGEILNVLHQNLDGHVEFLGCDLSPQAIEMAMAREKERLEFRLGELLDGDESFDVILVMDVIEHLEDYFCFLRGLRGRGAYTLLHIPLDLSALSVARPHPLLESRATVGHIHSFIKETALQSLVDTGYEIIDHSYTYRVGPPVTRKEHVLYGARRFLKRLDHDLAARLLGGYSLLVLAK